MKLGEFLNNKFWDFDIIKGKVKDELNENTEVELIKLCTEDVEDSMIGFDPKVGDYAPIKTVINTRLVAYFRLDDAVVRYKIMIDEIENFKDYGVKAVFIEYTTWGVNYIMHKIETVNVNRDEVIELWHYMNLRIDKLEKEYEKQLDLIPPERGKERTKLHFEVRRKQYEEFMKFIEKLLSNKIIVVLKNYNEFGYRDYYPKDVVYFESNIIKKNIVE